MSDLFDDHPRTLAARARCPQGPGSCHDCAMTCNYGNQVFDLQNVRLVPCGSEVFDFAGNIIVCSQCRHDAQSYNPKEH